MFVQTSARMSAMQCFENKVVRMPKSIREHLGVTIGEFIRLENDVVLQIDKPYMTDLNEFGETAFVTESTFQLLNRPENEEIEIVNTVTMGCDPELFLVNAVSGRQVSPTALFPKFGAVGYDGLMCELRPNPHVDTAVLRDNLFALITQAHHKIKSVSDVTRDIRLVSASAMFGGSAGFHCHMGIPRLFLNNKAPNYRKLTDIIARVLDFYVGSLAVIPEGSNQNYRRCSPFLTYGKVSDYRVDNRTLEYRVPGGVMLLTPALTEGLLAMCSMVTNDVIYKLKDYTNDFKIVDLPESEEVIKSLYPNIPDLTGLYNLICAPDTSLAEQNSEVVFSDIKSMVNYSSNVEVIEQFKLSLFMKYNSNDIWSNWTSRRSDNAGQGVQQPMDVLRASK